MSLSKRERVLAGVVAALVGVVGLRMVVVVFGSPLGGRQAQIDALNEKIERYQDQVLKAKSAQDRMADWNRRSLPLDVARAGSLYQNWLLELAGKAGFRQKKVDPGEVRARGEFFRQLPFTVRGQATLEELTAFLFDFYSAGHLHQIRRITLKPIEKSKDLDATITIEALVLPTADRKDQLSQQPAKRLALASVDEYRKAIAARNVLAPYRPPVVAPPVRREPEPKPFDASKHAYLNGIVVDPKGRVQAWITARTTGERFELHQGEKFRIGEFQATVVAINLRDVELEVNGKRQTIPLGSNVRGTDESGKEGPPPGAVAPPFGGPPPGAVPMPFGGPPPGAAMPFAPGGGPGPMGMRPPGPDRPGQEGGSPFFGRGDRKRRSRSSDRDSSSDRESSPDKK